MKNEYQIGIGPAARAVEYADQTGKILFTFDIDGETILLELDLQGSEERYIFAARAVRDFLLKRFKTDVDYWPKGLLAERCKSIEA